MEWIYTKDKTPITYKTGNWDGKVSDKVIAQDVNGKTYIADFNDGFMDGSAFKYWYSEQDFLIESEIIRWMDIPE